MQQWKKDVLCGSSICAIALFFFYDTLKMDDSVIEHAAAKAGNYTRFWLGLLIAMGIVLIIRALLKRDTTPSKSQVFNVTSVVTIGSLAVYVFALDYLGFVVSSIVFMFGLITYHTYKAEKLKDENGKWLEKSKMAKSLLVNLAVAVVITGISYYLFGVVIGLLLPKFSLF